jgi:hypothetical protein
MIISHWYARTDAAVGAIPVCSHPRLRSSATKTDSWQKPYDGGVSTPRLAPPT